MHTVYYFQVLLCISDNLIKHESFVFPQNSISNNSLWDKYTVYICDLIRCYFLGQSGPGSDGNKGLLYIPQSFIIAGASPSDCLVSCHNPGHSLGESYLSAEMQLVYSAAPTNWANQLSTQKQIVNSYICIFTYAHI